MEEAGLLSWEVRIMEMRLSHDDLGRESSLSAEASLPAVIGSCQPYLLVELPLDCVKALSLVDACSGSRRVFRRKIEVDNRGSVVCSDGEEKVAG